MTMPPSKRPPNHRTTTRTTMPPRWPDTQAKANIGMRMTRVELRSFQRTITIPGIVVERPGWSALDITAPMTGVVTRIYPLQGEAVKPGQPLFDIRLTHEDLLQKQTDFLRTVEELDVIDRELERLEKVAASGDDSGEEPARPEVRTAEATRVLRATPSPAAAWLVRRAGRAYPAGADAVAESDPRDS